MSRTTDDFVKELRERKLRVTPARVAVLRAVSELPGHPDAETIGRHARERIGTLSVQAVYDSLSALTGAGLLRRIALGGSPARFEARVGDNHHHLVCRSCGTAEDVDCAAGAAPCLEPSRARGFVIDEAEVTFWGTCPRCAASAVPGLH